VANPAEAVLDVAEDGIDPAKHRQVLGFAVPTTVGWWVQPMSVTPATQARPSETTVLLGARFALARAAMAAREKPDTGMKQARIDR
jgi:hypothetical protein